MVQGKILSYGDDLSEVYSIRRKVFVDELGVPEEIEFNRSDLDAMHVLVYEEAKTEKKIEKNKISVATGRIIYDGDCCRIDHIAVLKEYRNMQYGDLTVKMLINKAFTSGINEVIVEAATEVLPFFEKIGFQRVKEDSEHKNENYYIMSIHGSDVITKCGR